MTKRPFGVRRLDSICNGGAPAGSVVLLAAEPGAGGREFLASTVVMNGLAAVATDRFELVYGNTADSARIPEGIHYVSLTTSEAAIEREWRQVFDPALIEASRAAISVTDLSSASFSATALPNGWADGGAGAEPARQETEAQALLEALRTYLEKHGAQSLIAIDSLTALGTLSAEQATWREIAAWVNGLRRVAENWGGLVLLLLDEASVPPRALAQLSDAVDGIIRFEWVAGGHEIDRTMVLEKFRGLLATIADEDIVRFETEIDESGFKLSDVRKIR